MENKERVGLVELYNGEYGGQAGEGEVGSEEQREAGFWERSG
jgi:hypothetical protein